MNLYEQYNQQLDRMQPTADEAQFLARVDAYVDDNMTDGHLTVGTIASALCLHSAKLRRRIANITGLTPANYLLMLRMRHATALLASYPRHNISETALECGFADHAHFTHAFHRLFGQSPLRWIEQQHND